MHTVSVSLPKVSKKMESVPMEACFIADKYAISNRAVTELATAFRKDGGKNLEEYNLSVNTTGRRRQSARLEKAADITKWQLGDITSKMYALHWDGKLIKSLMHVGKDMERVAVILTGTDGQEVLLSIVGMEGRSTAENEAAKIIQVLNDHPLDTSRIGALVFDTTAVNSGVWSGVVTWIENSTKETLRHDYLELAELTLLFLGGTSLPVGDPSPSKRLGHSITPVGLARLCTRLSKALKDFIGHDSWSMFELLGIDSSFVKLPVAQWNTSDNYRHGKKVVANLLLSMTQQSGH
ncbi:hypothetical protein GWK47_032474 [Chionoecetes opilio]|uniref:Uncharacterized protein n=1 Tax=Chionoecetes opilio TaxID=41210 RepID=A0A8J5D4E0_CHIOP|nr:hypothetical protein GWK47_032474 [Chionoecetes opilio]